MKHIVFDFDGTIADSLSELVTIYNDIAVTLGFNKMTESTIYDFRKKNPRQILKCLGIPYYMVPIIAIRVRQLLKKRIPFIKPFTSIMKVLENLKESGYVMYILSSNSKENITLFLENNNIDYFEKIYSNAGIFGKEKMITRLIKDNNIPPDKIIYVGDEARDIEASKKSKIQCIAVTWGYNHKELLQQSTPDYLADKPVQLLEIIQRI